MRRSDMRRLAVLLVVLAAASILSSPAQAFGSEPGRIVFRKEPYLIFPGVVDEMQILWQLYATAPCTLDWGTDTTYSLGSVATTEYGTDHQHMYTLMDLAPEMLYFYRVRSGESRAGSFRAVPSPDAVRLKFLAYGDTRTYPADHDSVAERMIETYQADPEYQTLVILTGDLVGNGDLETDWDTQFFSPAYANIAEFHANVPTQAARGNHERDAILYAKYFPYPFVLGRAWSFDYGPAHFVVVDQYMSYSPGSPQLTWIENDLASSDKPWKFMYYHEPGWSAGGHSNEISVQTYLHPLCVEYGVQITFAGHNHYYARAVVDGIQHVTTGGGGAPLYTPDPGYPYIVATAEAHHFCKIEIDGDRLTCEVIEHNGTVLDRFALVHTSVPADYTVTLVVTDAATGDTLPARCHVVDSQGQDCYAQPDSASCLYHVASWENSSYWYTHGVSNIEVPDGPTEIGIARGFQYHSVLDTVDVQSDTTLVYQLQRWIDMNDQRWFSGDPHTHIAHSPIVYEVDPTHAHWAAQAEGLNVINCLDNAHFFTGGPDSCSTADCIVYVCKEFRSCVFGHASCLGLTVMTPPYFTFWVPTLADVADSVHQQPEALFIAAHPMTGADFFDLESISAQMLCRGVASVACRGKLDGYEVLSSGYSNFPSNRQMYYRLLNCGFEIPAVSGTDACLSTEGGRPPGCYQTFVYISPEQTFDYWSWLSNLAQGKTFVTNGPLFTGFNVQGLSLGERASVAFDSIELSGQFSVQCANPLLRADLMVNGEVDQSFFFGIGQTEMDAEFTVTIDKSVWLAIRVLGELSANDWTTVGDSLYAHTGPIYFEKNGDRILEYPDAEYFVNWTADLIQWTELLGKWDDPADSLHVLGQYYADLAYYQALADSTTVGIPESGPAIAVLGPHQPNPFGTDATIHYFVPGEGPIKLQIYNLAGRLVNTVVDEPQRIGRHTATWDGRDRVGRACGSGVYFCRLEGSGFSVSEKIVLIR